MATKRISGLIVTDEDYELLRGFAYEQRINGISEAVRYLIRMSPNLHAYAETKGLRVEFTARSWGGSRRQNQK